MRTDAILVSAGGVVVQVNRDTRAIDMPDRGEGTWRDLPAGEVCAGMVRQEDDSFAAPKPPPPLPPEVISDRQFAQALAKMGVITKDEALAFVKRGEVPATLQAVIDGIEDPDERFDVDMAVSGATTFERSNPSTLVLAAALKWSPEQMDDLWRSAAAIP